MSDDSQVRGDPIPIYDRERGPAFGVVRQMDPVFVEQMSLAIQYPSDILDVPWRGRLWSLAITIDGATLRVAGTQPPRPVQQGAMPSAEYWLVVVCLRDKDAPRAWETRWSVSWSCAHGTLVCDRLLLLEGLRVA